MGAVGARSTRWAQEPSGPKAREKQGQVSQCSKPADCVPRTSHSWPRAGGLKGDTGGPREQVRQRREDRGQQEGRSDHIGGGDGRGHGRGVQLTVRRGSGLPLGTWSVSARGPPGAEARWGTARREGGGAPHTTVGGIGASGGIRDRNKPLSEMETDGSHGLAGRWTLLVVECGVPGQTGADGATEPVTGAGRSGKGCSGDAGQCHQEGAGSHADTTALSICRREAGPGRTCGSGLRNVDLVLLSAKDQGWVRTGVKITLQDGGPWVPQSQGLSGAGKEVAETGKGATT